MNKIRYGDYVLALEHNTGNRQVLGRVLNVFKNSPDVALVLFNGPSEISDGYTTYYQVKDLKIVTKKHDPEYFI
jgi:hypothetical protein